MTNESHIKNGTIGKKKIYLPGLNGLRAIAALAVIISHTTLSLDKFGLNNKILGVDNLGNARGSDLAGNGVTIFFTLSGFLITYLLLLEKEIESVQIKNFYIRRILRIWPLYFLYFMISLVIAYFFHLSINIYSIPYYLFLSANIPFILSSSLPLLSHYWSLAVEEQFYLFFPQLVKHSYGKLVRLFTLLILILLFLKFISYLLLKRYHLEFPYLLK